MLWYNRTGLLNSRRNFRIHLDYGIAKNKVRICGFCVNQLILTGGFAINFFDFAMFLLCSMNSNSNGTSNDNDNTAGIGSILIAFIARMMYKIGVCTTWITTAEILPTSIRGTGHGFVNSIARLSAASSPYIMHGTSISTIGYILLIISIIVSYLVHKIPETKGQQLK